MEIAAGPIDNVRAADRDILRLIAVPWEGFMGPFDRSKLTTLARLEASPCLSIFLPVAGGADTGHKDAVRLTNLLRSAASEMKARQLHEATVRELIEPIERLADEHDFWAVPAGGLAIFSAPGLLRLARVDFALDERVVVGDRFAVRPLLSLALRTDRFYVLALSRRSVRLFEGAHDGFRQVDLPNLPTSFDAAMGYVEYDSNVYAHSSSAKALGRRSAIFHGHGDGDEENSKDDLVHFFRRIVDVLEQSLTEVEAPLVLAAVESYHPLFARANRRLHLTLDGIVGNPDMTPDHELGAMARKVVDSEAQRRRDAELTRWSELRGSRRDVEELAEIIRGADRGVIETLFLARTAERWGSYEPDLGRVVMRAEREAGDVELLDLAASRTLACGGDVYAVEPAALPEGRIAVAIRRFAAAA